MALPVEIVRSPRRRKTVQAILGDGVIRVHVPARMSQRDIDTYVAELVPRLERRLRSDHIDLDLRARSLARRYLLPLPTSVVWAENQRRRWGSCAPHSGCIRISQQLADVPPWVLDYVLVHELTHLVHADHSRAFTALVDRYPKAERARGYLMAMADRSHAPGQPSTGFDETDDLVDLVDPDEPDHLDDDDRGGDLDDPVVDDLVVDGAVDLGPTSAGPVEGPGEGRDDRRHDWHPRRPAPVEAPAAYDPYDRGPQGHLPIG
jgi:predicted metal-dependent hydrolase